MSQPQANRQGVLLMIAATLVLATQDGLSRHLVVEYNALMVVMIRYWFFLAFVLAIAKRSAGGVRAAAQTDQPWLQAGRGLLLAAEIVVSMVAYAMLGLIETHAIFVSYPLIVAALSVPLLGERVGWRRWAAISAAFLGVLIILQPGSRVFDPAALIALTAAIMFALYTLMTRYAARRDTAATSFFWTGVMGAVVMTPLGLWAWEPMAPKDWAFMAGLCLTGVAGHWLLIKCYEVAEASAVQPFTYFHPVFVCVIGVSVFHEVITWPMIIGASITVAAGLFALWRESLQG